MTKQTTTTEVQRLPYKLVEADDKGSWSIWRDNEQYVVEVSHSSSGRTLKKPIVVKVKATWTEADINLAKHIIRSLLQERMTRLIPFSLTQKTIWTVARYLKRSHSGSFGSLAGYTYDLEKFFDWIQQQPDKAYSWLLNQDLSPNYKRLKEFKAKVEDFVDTLQARGKANSSIRRQFACIKTWLKVNEIPLFHVDLPPRIVTYHDRAPTPGELSKWIAVADLREKVSYQLHSFGRI